MFRRRCSLALLFALAPLAHPASAATLCGGFTSMAALSPDQVLCGSIVPLAAVVPADIGFQRGCDHHYVLRSGDGSSGDWGYLDFWPCDEGPCAKSASTGSATLECELADGYTCGPIIGMFVRTRTGVRRGALRDAMTARFEQDTDAREGLCAADYLGNGRRILDVPVVMSYGKGTNVVRLVGFARFFLTARPSGAHDEVEAEFLYSVLPGCCGAPNRR